MSGFSQYHIIDYKITIIMLDIILSKWVILVNINGDKK